MRWGLLLLAPLVLVGTLVVATPADAATCCYDEAVCAYSWAWCTTWANPSCAGCTYVCDAWCTQEGHAGFTFCITCPPGTACGSGSI